MASLQTLPFISEKRFSELSGIPVSTLRTRRSREPEKAPPHHKLNGRIFYKVEEVAAWFDRQVAAEAGR